MPYAFLLRVGLLRSVNTLIGLGRKIVIVSDIPILKNDPYRTYWLASRFGRIPDFQKISPSITEYSNNNKDILLIFSELAKIKNITLIHPELILFNNQGVARIIANQKMLYIDATISSSIGSRYIEPVFNDVFTGNRKV